MILTTDFIVAEAVRVRINTRVTTIKRIIIIIMIIIIAYIFLFDVRTRKTNRALGN